MDNTLLIVVLVIVAISFLGIGLLFNQVLLLHRKIDKIDLTDNSQEKQLLLSAYERLTLFAERTGLQNLITRVNPDGDGAGSLHMALLQTIKEEYDYNLTQQIYVSPEVWNAITRLKDQNTYIINQIAATLPPSATALDLKKRILEYTSHENAELNKVVLDALRFEASKITGK